MPKSGSERPFILSSIYFEASAASLILDCRRKSRSPGEFRMNTAPEGAARCFSNRSSRPRSRSAPQPEKRSRDASRSAQFPNRRSGPEHSVLPGPQSRSQSCARLYRLSQRASEAVRLFGLSAALFSKISESAPDTQIFTQTKRDNFQCHTSFSARCARRPANGIRRAGFPANEKEPHRWGGKSAGQSARPEPDVVTLQGRPPEERNRGNEKSRREKIDPTPVNGFEWGEKWVPSLGLHLQAWSLWRR